MGRLYVLAFLFFLNEWLKPENLVTPDYEQAVKALQSFVSKQNLRIKMVQFGTMLALLFPIRICCTRDLGR